MTLHGFLQGSGRYGNTQALGEALKVLQREELDCLPLPGSGQTLERFSRLAQVAGHDLGLCKLFEGHTDALAIIAELHGPLPPSGSTWGMWAAEPPTAKVRVRRDGQHWVLDGRKAWCSGAAVVSHGLLTAWNEADEQQLVAVNMDQAGVTVTDAGWHAVGMAATGSVEIVFSGATGMAVGVPLRFAVGFCLAGVYPLGMKLVVSWVPEQAGHALARVEMVCGVRALYGSAGQRLWPNTMPARCAR